MQPSRWGGCLKKPAYLFVVMLMWHCVPGYGNDSEEVSLYDEILAMDRLLFSAFNDKNLDVTKAVFDPDLEFYHDEGGFSDYAQALKNSRQLFDADTGLSRELIVESMSVYPIAGYGAIQVGKHRFCHPENGTMDCGVLDFLHIWKKTNNTWTLTRVVSYAH